MTDWRPHRKGECPRRYHEEVESPHKWAGMVRYALDLPDNAARGRFLAEVRTHQGDAFYNDLRKAVWARLSSPNFISRKFMRLNPARLSCVRYFT